MVTQRGSDAGGSGQPQDGDHEAPVGGSRLGGRGRRAAGGGQERGGRDQRAVGGGDADLRHDDQLAAEQVKHAAAAERLEALVEEISSVLQDAPAMDAGGASMLAARL